MRVKIDGVVDSISEVIKDGKKEMQVYLNQQGEQTKTKIKFKGNYPIPPVGDLLEVEGRLVSGVYNNRPYQHIVVY